MCKSLKSILDDDIVSDDNEKLANGPILGLQAHQTMPPQFQVQIHPQVQVLQEREEE